MIRKFAALLVITGLAALAGVMVAEPAHAAPLPSPGQLSVSEQRGAEVYRVAQNRTFIRVQQHTQSAAKVLAAQPGDTLTLTGAMTNGTYDVVAKRTGPGTVGTSAKGVGADLRLHIRHSTTFVYIAAS